MARQKFCAVIPAWNEERTIGEVVRVFKTHPSCHSVIVVSDGSTDQTAAVARTAGARVIELPENRGKSEAMEIGIQAAETEVIFFSDADITGLNHKIISKMSEPILENGCAMYIALRGRPTYWLNRIIRFFPLLGGERVLTKELWYALPPKYRTGWKIETALNYYSKKLRKRARFSLFRQIRHVKKEVKYSFFYGFWLRIKMFSEVLLISVRLYIFDRGREWLRKHNPMLKKTGKVV